MADESWKLRTWFMMIVGSAIAILFIMSSTAFWKRNFREAILFIIPGMTLTLLFYRKRLAVLAVIGCTWIVVNGGLTAFVHPSVLGILATVVSAFGMVFFSRRVDRQYRGLSPDDWQKIFDKK